MFVIGVFSKTTLFMSEVVALLIFASDEVHN